MRINNKEEFAQILKEQDNVRFKTFIERYITLDNKKVREMGYIVAIDTLTECVYLSMNFIETDYPNRMIKEDFEMILPLDILFNNYEVYFYDCGTKI